MRFLVVVALVFASLLSGCGDDGGSPASSAGQPVESDGMESSDAGKETTTNTDPSTAEASYVQPGPWDGMTKGQKFEFMKEVVMPQMTLLLAELDPRYAQMSCKTCHGEGASDAEFKMPNGLAPLDVKSFPLDQSPDPKVAAAAKFMAERVTPKMAELLGRMPRSRDNPMGFGCFGCHARVE